MRTVAKRQTAQLPRTRMETIPCDQSATREDGGASPRADDRP